MNIYNYVCSRAVEDGVFKIILGNLIVYHSGWRVWLAPVSPNVKDHFLQILKKRLGTLYSLQMVILSSPTQTSVVSCRSLYVLFSFSHCVVYSSSICELLLPIWYLRAVLSNGSHKSLHQLPIPSSCLYLY